MKLLSIDIANSFFAKKSAANFFGGERKADFSTFAHGGSFQVIKKFSVERSTLPKGKKKKGT